MLALFGQEIPEVNEIPSVVSPPKPPVIRKIPKIKEKTLVEYAEEYLKVQDIKWALYADKMYDDPNDVWCDSFEVQTLNSELVRGKILAIKEMLQYFGFAKDAFDDCTPNLCDMVEQSVDPTDWEA